VIVERRIRERRGQRSRVTIIRILSFPFAPIERLLNGNRGEERKYSTEKRKKGGDDPKPSTVLLRRTKAPRLQSGERKTKKKGEKRGTSIRRFVPKYEIEKRYQKY